MCEIKYLAQPALLAGAACHRRCSAASHTPVSTTSSMHLDVPVALAQRVQAQLVRDLGRVHCVGQVLLVGKDQQHCVTQLVLQQGA